LPNIVIETQGRKKDSSAIVADERIFALVAEQPAFADALAFGCCVRVEKLVSRCHNGSLQSRPSEGFDALDFGEEVGQFLRRQLASGGLEGPGEGGF